MKFLQLFLFVFIIYTFKASHLNGVEPRELMLNDHEDKVNEKPDFQEAVIEEGQNTECNREILISYGLHGLEHSQVRKHRYCPAIKDNCCSNEDVKGQRKNWNNQFKFYIQRYYETFLYVTKYVLGFSDEAYLLATKFEQSDMLHCKNAALDLISMNLNSKMTERIYLAIRNRVRKISNLRRGFYCVICDGRNQKMTTQFFQNTNNFNNDKMYFSQEFCQELVSSAIESNYFDLYVVRKYLNNLNQLVNCQTGSQENVVFEVPIEIKQTVKNCFYFKDRYFFFFCEKYCEEFQITRPVPLFDGDVQQLQKFFVKLQKERHQAFRYPNNNILTDGVVFEENIINFNYTEIYKDMVFFRPITQQVLFDKFRTDVVFYGGVNPWLSVRNNKFHIILNYIEQIKMIVCAVVLGLYIQLIQIFISLFYIQFYKKNNYAQDIIQSIYQKCNQQKIYKIFQYFKNIKILKKFHHNLAEDKEYIYVINSNLMISKTNIIFTKKQQIKNVIILFLMYPFIKQILLYS